MNDVWETETMSNEFVDSFFDGSFIIQRGTRVDTLLDVLER